MGSLIVIRFFNWLSIEFPSSVLSGVIYTLQGDRMSEQKLLGISYQYAKF